MVIVSYDENDYPTGAIEIDKKYVTGYGYLANILYLIKNEGAYETNFYSYTIDNIDEWHNALPYYFSNEYNQIKVEDEMPFELLNENNIKLKR